MTAMDLDLDAYRAALAPALADSSLDHWRGALYASTEHRMADHSALTGVLYDGGWNRYGWPEEAGGLGGDARHRALLYDALSTAGLPVPDQSLLLETLAPAVIRFAPALAATYLPACLKGHEWWAPALAASTPGSARRDENTYVVSGATIRAPHAATAKRLITLVHTDADLSLLMIDVDTAAVSTRPVALAGGYNELGEITFDDALVPAERLIGDEGRALTVLDYLRAIQQTQHAWAMTGVALRRLRELTDLLADSPVADGAYRRMGECYSNVVTLRACSVATVREVATEPAQPSAGIDEILLAATIGGVDDLAHDLLGGDFAFSAAAPMQVWRAEWWRTRAASGSGDVRAGSLQDTDAQMAVALREVFRTRTADLDAALDELDWDEFVAADPTRAVRLLFTEQGRALVSSPLLDRVVLAQLPTDGARRAMLYPAGASEILLGDPTHLDEVLVPRASSFAVVPAAAVSARPVAGFGLGSGWHAVTGLDPDQYPQVGTAEQVWQAAAVGRHALTAELLGVCAAGLELIVRRSGDHSVTNRLAGASIALRAAQDLLLAAQAERSGWAASLAKARAGHTQAAVMRTLSQLVGIDGLVAGGDTPRHVSRAACLELLLGGHAELDERIGRTLLRREVPFLPVVEL